jgi:cold shock CspA family protein
MDDFFEIGAIKHWNGLGGYGFIATTGDTPDCFVHIVVLPRAPYVGEQVRFRREATPRGDRARDVSFVHEDVREAWLSGADLEEVG